MSEKKLSQNEIKELAKQNVGDGGSPNMWFVTYGPYVAVDNNYEDNEGYDYELIPGYDKYQDTFTFGPFATYKEALDRYDEIELDIDYGIGQAFIEDRECGTVTEKWLRQRVKVEYVQDEQDQSKYFYNKK